MAIARLIAAAIICFAEIAAAQGDPCKDALVETVATSSSSVSRDARLATLVSQGERNKAKQAANGSTDLFGVPLGASYSGYQDSAKTSYATLSSSMTESDLENIAWMGLTNANNRAYEACLQANLQNTPGLHLAVKSATESDITILVLWHPNPGNNSPAKVTWSPSNIFAGKELQTSFPDGGTAITVPRPDGAVSLVANATFNSGAYTSEVLTLEPTPINTEFSISDKRPYKYDWSFSVSVSGGKAFIDIANPCGGLLQGANYGFYVNESHPTASVPLVPGCSTYAYGTVTLTYSNQNTYIHLEGGLHTTDGSDVKISPQVIARLRGSIQ